MCGRLAQTLPHEAMRRVFKTTNPPVNLRANYDAAPTQDLGLVRLDPDTGARRLDLLRWGLVPRWAKDLGIGAKAINARGETLAEKPMFRDAFRRRRCIVPATAFYEWKREGKAKQPFAIGLQSGEPLALGGLWERWQSPAGETVETFAIVTVAANEAMEAIHDRMTVITGGRRLAALAGRGRRGHAGRPCAALSVRLAEAVAGRRSRWQRREQRSGAIGGRERRAAVVMARRDSQCLSAKPNFPPTFAALDFAGIKRNMWDDIGGTRLISVIFFFNIRYLDQKNGGQGGIRTRGGFYTTHAFQACALNHSATCPVRALR